MERNTGGYAFPNPALANEGFMPSEDMGGMTLRDWFAGQALATAAALPHGLESRQQYAKIAYEMADAMIAAREGSDQ